MNAEVDPRVKRAEQVARSAASDIVTDEHGVTLSEEGDNWVFVFLPKGRVRGGGAQVTVSQKTMELVDVLYLQ